METGAAIIGLASVLVWLWSVVGVLQPKWAGLRSRLSAVGIWLISVFMLVVSVGMLPDEQNQTTNTPVPEAEAEQESPEDSRQIRLGEALDERADGDLRRTTNPAFAPSVVKNRSCGVVSSLRRSNVAHPTRPTITRTRSRSKIGSSPSWAGSTVRTRDAGSRASSTRTSSTWWLGPRRTTAVCAPRTLRPDVASRPTC